MYPKIEINVGDFKASFMSSGMHGTIDIIRKGDLINIQVTGQTFAWDEINEIIDFLKQIKNLKGSFK